MKKQLISVAAIALTSALLSTPALAHVKGGAVISGNKNAITSGNGNCVTVASGSDIAKCHGAKPKKSKPIASKILTLVGGALFATNSAELSAGGKAALDDFASRSTALEVTNITVVGHADSRGDEAYNLALSQRRAATVKDYLVSKGINASKIFTSGLGEAKPIASNDTAAGRAQNRRVELSVTGLRR